jgi:hypothetical protein
MRCTDPELGMRMANGKCRMHGGASPGEPRSAGNGMWKHGLRSIEAIERRRMIIAEMRKDTPRNAGTRRAGRGTVSPARQHDHHERQGPHALRHRHLDDLGQCIGFAEVLGAAL